MSNRRTLNNSVVYFDLRSGAAPQKLVEINQKTQNAAKCWNFIEISKEKGKTIECLGVYYSQMLV